MKLNLRTISIPKVVLLLLCVANILNLFAARGGVAGSVDNGMVGLMSRSIIQAMYGLVAILMFPRILFKRIPTFIEIVRFLLVLSFIYFFNYIRKGNTLLIGNYLRLLTNLMAFIYFYDVNLSRDSLIKYLKYYSLTLLFAICFKIIIGGVFSNERLVAGDTASLGLVFLVPLIFMIFPLKKSHILFGVIIAFTMISLRRTSILALCAMIPFLIDMRKLKFKYLLFAIPILFIAIGFAYQSVGEALTARFSTMISPNRGESIGSGREFFYLELIFSYWASPSNYLAGFGMGAIYDHFYKMNLDYLNHAHNDFLELLYTFGLIGLIPWLLFLFQVYRARTVVKKINGDNKLLLASLAAYLVIAIFSGTLLRIEMLPFVMSISLLLSPKIEILRQS